MYWQPSGSNWNGWLWQDAYTALASQPEKANIPPIPMYLESFNLQEQDRDMSIGIISLKLEFNQIGVVSSHYLPTHMSV